MRLEGRWLAGAYAQTWVRTDPRIVDRVARAGPGDGYGAGILSRTDPGSVLFGPSFLLSFGGHLPA